MHVYVCECVTVCVCVNVCVCVRVAYLAQLRHSKGHLDEFLRCHAYQDMNNVIMS